MHSLTTGLHLTHPSVLGKFLLICPTIYLQLLGGRVPNQHFLVYQETIYKAFMHPAAHLSSDTLIYHTFSTL